MITVLKEGATEEQRNQLIAWFEEQGVQVHAYVGEFQTVLGLIGDTSGIDVEMLELLDIVERVTPISEPFKSANRKFHPEDSVIDAGRRQDRRRKLRGDRRTLLRRNPEQIKEVAEGVKAAGATLLRGGAFKPRTSPYDFQGMKAEGIELLLEAKQATGLPIVTEIMNANHLPLFEEVDVIQVGARNMQNFELLKELGRIPQDHLAEERPCKHPEGTAHVR